MGVPKFFRWLSSKKEFKSTYLPSIRASLSIDLNSELHNAAAQAYGYEDDKYNPSITKSNNNTIIENNRKTLIELEEKFIKVFISNLTSIVQLVGATETLYLAIDGVPPYAKMVQQRNRRFRTPWNRNPDIKFDSNALTPGTSLMRHIDASINTWIKETGNLPSTVIYSGPNEPGEGEHKIMDAFREGKFYSKEGRHIILGMDTDLFMLSLLLPHENIYLWRPQPKGGLEVISIKQSRKTLSEIMANSNPKIASSDFVLITSLLGNDFVPRHPSLEDFQYSIDILIEIYRKDSYKDGFYNKSINWSMFLPYFKKLAILEADFLVHNTNNAEYPVPFDILNNAVEPGGFSYSKFRSGWYTHIEDHESLVLNSYDTDTLVTDMVLSYMETLEYVQSYYRGGANSIAVDFSYKFHYAPLLSDVYNISTKNHKIISKQRNWAPVGINTFLHPLHLLSAVLPLQSKGHIYRGVSNQLEDYVAHDDEWSDYWPLYEPDVDYQGHGQKHTGVVLIPFPPLDKIKVLNLPLYMINNDPYASVGLIVFNPMRFSAYSPIKPITPIRKQSTLRKQSTSRKQRIAFKPEEKPKQVEPMIDQEIEVLPNLQGLFTATIGKNFDAIDPVQQARDMQYVDPFYL